MPHKLNHDLRVPFENFLFTKGYLVNWDGENRQDCVRALYALANVFGIRIRRNPQLAVWRMVDTAKQIIGTNVPRPFYTGFPQSVLKLTEDQLLIDQLIHYAVTYGLGDFSQPGHSLLEEQFERVAFREKTEIKEFEIVEEEEAIELMKSYVNSLLASSRPLNRDMEALVVGFAQFDPEAITVCNCKDTAIRLLYETRDVRYARFLQLPDVIKLADEINDARGIVIIRQEAREKARAAKVRNAQLRADYERKCNEHTKRVLEYNAKISRYNKANKAYQTACENYQKLIDIYGKHGLPLPAHITAPEKPNLVRPIAPSYPMRPNYESETVRPEKKDIRQLNLRNQDRKLIAAVIDAFFEQENPNVRDCYEKRKLWAGLLHHIHYVPKNDAAADFVQAMRGKGENQSVYAAFEAVMDENDVKKAAGILARGKGSGAVGRNLNYLLSRCRDASDMEAVVSCLDSPNLILLIQMLLQYRHYHVGSRTFKFVRHHKLTRHEETPEEAAARRSIISEGIRAALEAHLTSLLKKKLAAKAIGKVYIEAGMEKYALPLQEATGASGLGVLPRGSRLRIPEGNKLRCFTYWEKADDIDLACFGLEEKGTEQIEFSWRSMANMQDQCLTFSGDQTSGYDGGSEYFDVRLPQFREKYPEARYLVFTDNVFSRVEFDKVLCTAGYMIREEEDSGEVFEPKTVQSSFRITGDTTFAILFALDLKEREIIWLNLGLDSRDPVAGESDIAMVRDYLDAVETINMASFFAGMATEIVDRPEDADVIVADHYDGQPLEGQKCIRSCDYEKILEYLNTKPEKHI